MRNLRRVGLSILLTGLFLGVGIFIDDHANPDNLYWQRIESLLNLPAWVCSKIVGAGHGFAQLVLPFVFSLVFYVAVFWAIITSIETVWKKRERSST